MRASRMNLVTLREDPSEAEIASHRLLMRGGFLHKSGAGLYLYAPLLKRVLDKAGRIVADEISRTGGLEVTMPIMQEQALWEKSGRWATYQASRTMLTVKDRGGQVFGLAPTAEEVVTDYAATVVKSYKQLPVTFFQQHTKFRDEIRPRFGLMRAKEFIMKDAYSFDTTDEAAQLSYQKMYEAYLRIFHRCGLRAMLNDRALLDSRCLSSVAWQRDGRVHHLNGTRHADDEGLLAVRAASRASGRGTRTACARRLCGCTRSAQGHAHLSELRVSIGGW